MDEQDVVQQRGMRWRQEPRPRIRPPRTRAEIGAYALAVFGLVALLVVTMYWWATLPAIIPTHFGLDGKPNSYGPKETMFLMPGILLVMLALFAVLSRYPWLFNYPVAITQENATRQYRRGRMLLAALGALVAWFFTFLQWQVGLAASGSSTFITDTSNPATLILFIVVLPAGDDRRDRVVGHAGQVARVPQHLQAEVAPRCLRHLRGDGFQRHARLLG